MNGRAVALFSAEIAALAAADAPWAGPVCNYLAKAYMNRGIAKQGAAGHGPGAAILDYDQAIAIREALRQALEPRGTWDPPLRNALANAYVNRSNARRRGPRAGGDLN